MWFNFHTHSQYCDGKGELIEYVRSAQEKSMVSVGFSSHAPLPFESKWCMKEKNLTSYLNEIDILQKSIDSIEIYKGLEIDFIPGVLSVDSFFQKLDYTIGSVHFVEKLPDGRYWEIDGQHSLFLEGLETIFNNNIRDVITRYFELTREMVSTDCPSVVGHLDKIKIQNIGNKFFNESDRWYKEEITKTLDVIAQAGPIIEVNTRGIYQKRSPTTYPSPWVLELICKKGIPITLSSDAHHPDDIINQFSDTATLLKEIGFKKISLLREYQWQQYGFDRHGIINT